MSLKMKLDLQWLYNFIVSEGKCCESREGCEITCCHRDESMLNRFIISCPHSFVLLVNFPGPSGIEHLLKSQPLCISIWATFQVNSWMNQALESGSLLLAPWGNISIMDAIENNYLPCVFCSRDYNQELWRNMNEANTPSVHTLLY